MMRALDRLISFVFSVIMLVVSIVLILVGVGLVEPQMIIDMINEHVFVEEMITANMFNTLTIVGVVLFLASLKTTIFLSLFKTKDKSPILVKTGNGEVEIAQETIINTVRNVGTSFENIKDVQAKMIKKRRGVIIYAMVMVYANSNIKEITEEMQKQVKEVVKASTGVNVLEVNIKVKNIYSKPKKNNETIKVNSVENKQVVLDSNVIEEIKENVEDYTMQESDEQLMINEEGNFEVTNDNILPEVEDEEEKNKEAQAVVE